MGVIRIFGSWDQEIDLRCSLKLSLESKIKPTCF